MARRRRTRRSRRVARRGRRSRRYGRRAQRTTAFTSETSRPFTTRYRGRKNARSTYIRDLYNSTKYKPHFRSTEETSGTITTGAGVETASVHLQRALFLIGARGGGNPFWTAASGAFPVDATAPVPGFNGDIILRGGIARVTAYNASATDAARVDIIGMWSNAHPKDLFGTDFLAPVEWDPSLTPEFLQMGKVISRKETILEPHSSMMVTYKFKIQKLDQVMFVGVDGIGSDTPSASTLFWFIKCTPMNTVPVPVIYVSSYSLSFCGDAIGA